jgi:hypothetical protein
MTTCDRIAFVTGTTPEAETARMPWFAATATRRRRPTLVVAPLAATA